MTSRTPGGRSIYSATRTHGEQSHLTECICDRRPAYCLDHDRQIHRECDRRKKMVNLKLGNETPEVFEIGRTQLS